MMNYRKKYEDLTGRPIPPGYEVHHIDKNELNHKIENTVAIPVILHKRVHDWLEELPDKIIPLQMFQWAGCNQNFDLIEQSRPIFDSLAWFIDFRNYLLIKNGHQIFWGSSRILSLNDQELTYSDIEKISGGSYEVT